MTSRVHRKVEIVVVSAVTALLLLLASPARSRVLEQVQKLEDVRLGNADSLVFSPDGRHLYVGAGLGSAVFERDPATGNFAFVETFGSIVSLRAGAGAISPDGRSFYMIFYNSDHDFVPGALQVYRRDATSGKVELLEVHDGFFHDVAISPDGRHVYATRFNDLVAFSRDLSNGGLTLVQASGIAVGGTNALVVSPDGLQVYLAISELDAVAVLTRDTATGTLTLLEGHFDGTGGVEGLDGAAALAISADGENLYVGSFIDDALAVFAREPNTGSLTFLESHDFGVGALEDLRSPQFLALSPGDEHLYVSTVMVFPPSESRLGVFARDAATGTLSFQDAVEVETDGRPQMAISPNGEQLLLAGGDFFTGVFELARAATGELTALGDFGAEQPRAWNGGTRAAITPDGRHLYMASRAEDAVSAFARDAESGELSFLEATYGGQDPPGLFSVRNVIVSPDGGHLYAASAEGVTVYARDMASGGLSVLETYDSAGGFDRIGETMAISPDGRHFFVEANDRAVAVFARDAATGGLSFLEVHVDGENGVEGLRGVEALAASADGRQVYAAGHDDHAVAAFTRDTATGALSFLEAYVEGENGVEGLTGASAIAFSPGGAHLYVASAHALAVFARDGTSGALTFLKAYFDGENGIDGLTDGQSVVVSPDGREVFVASPDRSVATFARDGASGLLSLIELQSERVGGVEGLRLGILVMSPDGRHLYETSGGRVVAFRRNPGPCLDGPTALCLQGSRFRAEVEWRDPAGEVGSGKLVPYGSDDSGLFWFFSPDNWELQVKVLDACAAWDRFWVFAAATTHVEYTLRVTDTFTGEVKEYFNPLGQASTAITDTNAFATCAAPPPPGAVGRESVAGLAVPARASAGSAASAGSTTSAVPEIGPFKDDPLPCFRSPSTLCLADERFQATVTWRDFRNATGTGRVAYVNPPDLPPFTYLRDSGLFWFFNPENWEMQIKVLDGCAINGHVWVFAAATTNVEYTLTVVDTHTGIGREYFNPLGNAAPAITDTAAFAACP